MQVFLAEMEDLDALSVLSSSDDEDFEDLVEKYVVKFGFAIRESKQFRPRWDSARLTKLAQDEGTFIAELRLDPRSFNLLVEMLDPILRKNPTNAANSLSGSGAMPISVASRVAVTLIMLAGGRYVEAMRTHGIPRCTAYSVFHEVLDAIISLDQLKIHCPNDRSSLERRAEDFARLSKVELFKHCTGAIDGLAITITARSKKEVRDQRRFYNGNKKKHCLNMQAVCDANRRFLAVCCKHTGNTNDVDAFNTSNLNTLNATLDFPYHWMGDAAYVGTETMMVPFSGVNLSVADPPKHWFNFWHSQLRITIECAFGMFVNRWGIFGKELRFSTKSVIRIVHACSRLHNYCIDQNLSMPTPIEGNSHMQLNSQGTLMDPAWRQVTPQQGNAFTRPDIIVSNSLRDRLEEEVRRRNLYHERSFTIP